MSFFRYENRCERLSVSHCAMMQLSNSLESTVAHLLVSEYSLYEYKCLKLPDFKNNLRMFIDSKSNNFKNIMARQKLSILIKKCVCANIATLRISLIFYQNNEYKW